MKRALVKHTLIITKRVRMIIEMPEIGSKYIQYPDCFLQTVLSHQVKEFNSLSKTRNTGLFLFSQKINDFSIWVAK